MMDKNIKAMLVSLGGSPKAIISSLKEYKPEFVVFFVSDQSAILIDEVLKNIDLKKYKIEITHNPDDLEECYRVATNAIKLIFDEGYNNDEVAVDYTGGTKNMTAAAALASVDYGVFYSYVSGEKRTKDGLGIVIDGTEKVLLKSSPWDLLAENYLRKIRDSYNNCHFYVSFMLADELSKKATKNHNLFKRLTKLFNGIYLWDEFRYKEAAQTIREANPGVIKELAEEYNKSICDFAKKMQVSFGFLNRINNKIEKKSRYNKEIVLDMIKNAMRKAELGRYNDAILRLYRAVELWTQWKLMENNIDTSNVPKKEIMLLPEPIRNNLKPYKNGYYKLGLKNSMKLLAEKKDKQAQYILNTKEKEFNDLMRTRNYCPLEHNLEPRLKKDFERLYQNTLEFINIDNVDEIFGEILPKW